MFITWPGSDADIFLSRTSVIHWINYMKSSANVFSISSDQNELFSPFEFSWARIKIGIWINSYGLNSLHYIHQDLFIYTKIYLYKSRLTFIYIKIYLKTSRYVYIHQDFFISVKIYLSMSRFIFMHQVSHISVTISLHQDPYTSKLC